MAQHIVFPQTLPVEDAVRYLRAISHLMTADPVAADKQVERTLQAAFLAGSLPDPDRASLGALYRHLRVCLKELPGAPHTGAQPFAACLSYDDREILILVSGIGLSLKDASLLLGQPTEMIRRRLREVQSLLCNPCQEALAPSRAA